MKKLALALSVLLVAAFASAEPFVWPSAWSNASPEEAVTGGVLRDSMISDPRTFNPIVTAESQELSDHIFAGAPLIFRGPDSDEWVPYAAESFTTNEEGTVVDVVIREGVLWSDGEPVTAQDYYTTYLLETDPDIGANGYDSWFMDEDKILVEVTGDNSLRFTFPRPDRLAFPVVAVEPTRDSIFGEAYRTGGAEAVQALWGTDVDLSTTV
ncbi:MAG TPA: ABC transporter substrate-binding protein, partial [Trueperaceae bacterium]|nr:ABC transporter substrate-binding protein [Trueperaceae bacterium]